MTCKDNKKDNEVDSRLNQLVSRLLDKRVIPFIGAGVSYNARQVGTVPACFF